MLDPTTQRPKQTNIEDQFCDLSFLKRKFDELVKINLVDREQDGGRQDQQKP